MPGEDVRSKPQQIFNSLRAIAYKYGDNEVHNCNGMSCNECPLHKKIVGLNNKTLCTILTKLRSSIT